MTDSSKLFQHVIANKRLSMAVLITAIFLLNFFLFFDSLHHDFLKDDFRLIVENHRIKDFQIFIHSLDGKFFSFPDFPYLHYWRPLTLFTFFVDYSLWGLNPTGFHLFNIILNALNGILVFLIFYYLTRKSSYAFAVAVLFSVHPSHVEAVSWISGRTDLLAAFFIFSAGLFFILFLQKSGLLFLTLSTIAFGLGLLAKENSALFPLLACGLLLVFNRHHPADPHTRHRRRCYYLMPFVLLDVLFVFVHNSFSGAQNVLSDVSITDFFLVCKTIGVYTKLTLTPFLTTPYLSMQEFDAGGGMFYLYFLIMAAIVLLLIFKPKEYTYSIYALLFFIFLLPVLDPEIVPSYPKVALRFVYIPALFAGVFFMDSIRLLKSKHLKTVLSALLIITGLIWTVETVGFQDYFSDTATHYRRLIAHHPDDASLLLPLAYYYADAGHYADALTLTNHAVIANTGDRWLNVTEMAGLLKANLLIISGDLENGSLIATELLEKTQKREITYFAYVVLAKGYEKKQDLTTALAMLKKAEAEGETADVYFRMAMVTAKMSDFTQAVAFLEKAIQLNPTMNRYHQLKNLLLKEITPNK